MALVLGASLVSRPPAAVRALESGCRKLSGCVPHEPFEPLFRNPHVQTVAGLFERPGGGRARRERRLFLTEPEAQVLVGIATAGAGGRRPGCAPLHGLEGSAESGYMRGMAAASLRAGFAVHLFNCAFATRSGSRTPFTMRASPAISLSLWPCCASFAGGAPPLFLVGFPPGGNVALKLAGELGAEGAELLAGVAAVSTPIDLEASARRLGDFETRLYERRFVRRMLARLRATGRYRPADFDGLRTLWAIDDRITAPSFGFGGAANYYRTQSAMGAWPGYACRSCSFRRKTIRLSRLRRFNRMP